MTLKRTLEPEVMDSEQEAFEYNQMDHSEVNRQFVAELLSFTKDRPCQSDSAAPLKVLDLGTGTALIPIELCRQHATCHVTAIDMADHMLQLAACNVAAANLQDRIELAKVDAKQLPYENDTFDIVMSNSIIHHIPQPLTCLAQMQRVGRANGVLFVRDLMRPADAETIQQLVQTYAGDETEYSRQLFQDSLHAALSLDEIREMVTSLGFAQETVTATSDRHWTWEGKLKIESGNRH